MTIWGRSMERAITGLKRKEDMFFPYDLDELDDVYSEIEMITYDGETHSRTINNYTKHKKIEWFFQDNRGKSLIFSKEFCLDFLRLSPYFTNIDNIPESVKFSEWGKNVPNKDLYGIYVPCNKHLGHDALPEDFVVIYMSPKLINNSYRVLTEDGNNLV